MISIEHNQSNISILSTENEPPFRVTDLKQWVYCKRILYFYFCLPNIRPKTFKMDEGKDQGKNEEDREKRRSLQLYGLADGRKEFNVIVSSRSFGLRGKVDMVIWRDNEVIPVDYKFSLRGNREHFKLQLTAYGVLLEESSGIKSHRGFIYSIPERKSIEIKFTEQLRTKFFTILREMNTMLFSEKMPEAAKTQRMCLVCEFKRFCNDVL